jgi:hypothetical protein
MPFFGEMVKSSQKQADETKKHAKWKNCKLTFSNEGATIWHSKFKHKPGENSKNPKREKRIRKIPTTNLIGHKRVFRWPAPLNVITLKAHTLL